MSKKPVVLMILDGYGLYGNNVFGNRRIPLSASHIRFGSRRQ